MGTITGHSSPGVAWQALTRVGWSHLCVGQCCPCGCSPESDLPSLLQWCTVDSSLLSTRTLRSLSARLFVSHTDPSLYCALWLCHTRCRTSHLSLLNFILFSLAHSSGMSGSICKVTLHSDVFTSPRSLVPSANLVRTLQFCLLGYLRRCWTPWGPASVPGGSHLWQVVSLNENHWSPSTEAACEPISYTSHRPPIQSVSCQFVQEKVVGNNVHFAEVQANNIHCFPILTENVGFF